MLTNHLSNYICFLFLFRFGLFAYFWIIFGMDEGRAWIENFINTICSSDILVECKYATYENLILSFTCSVLLLLFKYRSLSHPMIAKTCFDLFWKMFIIRGSSFVECAFENDFITWVVTMTTAHSAIPRIIIKIWVKFIREMKSFYFRTNNWHALCGFIWCEWQNL